LARIIAIAHSGMLKEPYGEKPRVNRKKQFAAEEAFVRAINDQAHRLDRAFGGASVFVHVISYWSTTEPGRGSE
jgi:N-acetyl-beta-hexosaminidase